MAWLAGPDGEPIERVGIGTPDVAGAQAVIEAGVGSPLAAAGTQLRFRPGGGREDLRGDGWDLDGDLGVLGLEHSDGAHRRARPTPTRWPACGRRSPPRTPATCWSHSRRATRPWTGAA